VQQCELPAAVAARLADVEPEAREKLVIEMTLIAEDPREAPTKRTGALLIAVGLRAIIAGGDPVPVLAEFFL
jgi:hypothetical protein